MVSNPFFFVSFRIYLDSSSFSWASCQDSWKGVFSCSKILYLCLGSLGLDITSVNFNHFKTTATCPFLWFLSSKESYKRRIPARYTFDTKRFTNSNKFSFFFFETCLNWILSIYRSKRYLRSWNSLLIGINPRPLPLRNESRLSTRATSYTGNIKPQQKKGGSSRTEERVSSQEHLHFDFI